MVKSLLDKIGVTLIGLTILGYTEVWGTEPTPQSRINFEPLIYAFFGWVLGFVGTLVLEWLKRRRVKKDFLIGVCAELKEVLPRLAGTYFILKSNLGEKDRDVLNWIKSVRSQGYQFLEEKTVEAIDKQLEMNDEQIKAMNELIKQKRPQADVLRKFGVPLLEENISSITLLDSKLQHSLLDIRTKINLVNEMVDQNNFFFEKTFDSGLSRENSDILDLNIRNGYALVGKWCRKISELIMNILEEMETTK